MDSALSEMMTQGNYFYKHDFGRNKRSRKWLVLSTDNLSLRWRSVGANEVVGQGDGSTSARGGSSAACGAYVYQGPGAAKEAIRCSVRLLLEPSICTVHSGGRPL